MLQGFLLVKQSPTKPAGNQMKRRVGKRRNIGIEKILKKRATTIVEYDGDYNNTNVNLRKCQKKERNIHRNQIVNHVMLYVIETFNNNNNNRRG